MLLKRFIASSVSGKVSIEGEYDKIIAHLHEKAHESYPNPFTHIHDSVKYDIPN